MDTIYVVFGAIILYSIGHLSVAKPFDEEKSFSNDNKLNCMGSNEAVLDYEKAPNSYSDYYNKPHSKFEASEKFPSRNFEFDKKRSTAGETYDLASGLLEKRQVGVVYKDDRPIGILQPFQRSYRFIPVKEEDNKAEESSLNLPGLTDVEKREVNLDGAQLEESYPSILTNFKIDDKLDKKRNYDMLTDDNVRDLKATIRRLRSSNPHNSEQIEEELKNILDDMGLIEDEEAHGGEKREISENDDESDDEVKVDKERSKRDDSPCIRSENSDTNKAISEQSLLTPEEKRNEAKSSDDFAHIALNKRENEDETKESKETPREKREKQEASMNKDSSGMVEGLKDSEGGNKSPEITEREVENKDSDKRSSDEEDDDYEKRVERKIQSKINTLKEEVKREIDALKKRDNDDDEDDTQRKKRQVYDNLMSEESDELNPVMNPDGELKPLIRKRRGARDNKNAVVRRKRETGNRKKRRNKSDSHSNEKTYKARRDESEEVGDLLGGEDDGTIVKRHVYNIDEECENDGESNLNQIYERNKRAGILSNDFDPYNNYFYDNGRSKRQNIRENDLTGNKLMRKRFVPFRRGQWRSRFRRRINENQGMANRPQQLSDMSDIDLFGALPKSYDGELSRYKRVKKK